MDTTGTQRSKPASLEKQLGLWDVYALATGATLSTGFFLIPGLAAAGAGTAMAVSYILAAAILLPGLMAQVELATAMPRAGGIYYFLDRSLGPLVGTVGGFGTWTALVLKSAFALIGIGAYMRLFFPNLEMGPIAAVLAILFGIVNLFGTKKSGSFQQMLLIALVLMLGWFCGVGVLNMELSNFGGFLDAGTAGIVSTAGLVIVSYMGLIKVVGVAEEVKNPGRNLPLGMFLASGTVMAVFVLGAYVMIGVVGVDVLSEDGGDLAPVATVAERLAGRAGAVVMTVAAVFAFSSAANAGILSASRYPLAMGRDRLLPDRFSEIGRFGTPTVGIAATVGVIVLCVTLIDPTKIAKLASAFLLMVFALGCLAVIVMRESRIHSYDPEYRSPFYPGLQIAGVLGPLWLIVRMGLLPTLFTGGLIMFGAMWYTYYARERLDRAGAIYHVFERLGRERYEGRDRDLADAVLNHAGHAEVGTEIWTEAHVLDLSGSADFADLARRASEVLARRLSIPSSTLLEGFLEGTRIGGTPMSRGAALPHQLLDEVDRPCLVLARVPGGVRFTDLPRGRAEPDPPIRAVFFLVGGKEDPTDHLYILAQIASRVDQQMFMTDWLAAEDAEELKDVLTRDEVEGILVLLVGGRDGTGAWVGRRIMDLGLPDGTLVATVRRGGELIVPGGDTQLLDGDYVTVIGEPAAIREVRDRRAPGPPAMDVSSP